MVLLSLTRLSKGENILKPMTPGFVARYNPKRDLNSPVKPRNASIEQLLAAGAHIGHNKSLCHPAMKPFITGLHGTTHIINLDYTLVHLRRACTIVRELSFRQGVIVILGTRKGHKPILVKASERMGGYIISRKWIAGTLTNGVEVLYRGYSTEQTTPFRFYATDAVKERLTAGQLWNEPTVKRMVWDKSKEEWIESEEEVPIFRDWKGDLRSGPRDGNILADENTSMEKGTATDSVESSQSGYPVSQSVDNEIRKSNARRGLPLESGTSSDIKRSGPVKNNGELNEFLAARKRGDLANWMAWEKFAAIVQSVSDLSTEFLAIPQQLLHQNNLPELSLDPIDDYIPDHADDWYSRELAIEKEEMNHKKLISDENGDRSALEMYAMDQFLAKKRYHGKVRNEYVVNRIAELEGTGLPAYPQVKVFRDGSTMVGKQRYDRDGKPLLQYSDGSYVVGDQLFDRNGMRYEAQSDSLVFSDGSELKFIGEGNNRRLIVVIGSLEFDATSAVLGSAEKREILEKAADLLESSHHYRSLSVESEATSLILGGSSKDVDFKHVKLAAKDDSIEDAEGLVEDNENLSIIKGSEMLEISDKVEGKALDEEVAGSNRKLRTAGDESVMKKLQEPSDNTPFSSTRKTANILRPDLLIVLNPRENRLALREATNNQIPTIGIIDTDCDPRIATYSIPGNDDSLRSVEYITGVLSRAGEEGLIHRQRYAEQLSFLLKRAHDFHQQSWQEYSLLFGADEEQALDDDANSNEVKSIMNKYCEWYSVNTDKLDPKTLQETVRKLVSQHIVLAQNEIKRLNINTQGWSMQQTLDHVKTSTQFPGVPKGVMEDLAKERMTKSRQAWAEAKEQVAQRTFKLPEEPIQT